MTADLEHAGLLYQAYLRGDLDTMTALLHPQVTLIVPGQHPLSGRYVGYERIVKGFLEPLAELTEDSWSLRLIALAEDDGLVMAVADVTADRGNRHYAARHMHLMTMEAGRLRELRIYVEDQATADAFFGTTIELPQQRTPVPGRRLVLAD